MDEIKQIVAGETEGVLTEVYKDLLSPTVKPVGTMLSLLPRTIRLALGKWEKWIINGEESLQLTAQALRIKVENIPEDKLCEPEPYIAVPAIYADEPEKSGFLLQTMCLTVNIKKEY